MAASHIAAGSNNAFAYAATAANGSQQCVKPSLITLCLGLLSHHTLPQISAAFYCSLPVYSGGHVPTEDSLARTKPILEWKMALAKQHGHSSKTRFLDIQLAVSNAQNIPGYVRLYASLPQAAVAKCSSSMQAAVSLAPLLHIALHMF